MVVVKKVSAKTINDSANEKTIMISVETNVGKFSASSPTGKSTGKHEKKPYKKDLKKDIETIKKFSKYFSEDNIDFFSDLKRIEDIVDGHVGANTLFALEASILKALAKEKKKEVWELIIDSEIKKLKFPKLVGNCIGGGKHSEGKQPDFQEFLLIPEKKGVKESFETNKKIKKEISYLLLKKDKKFQNKKNCEDAWITELNDKEVLDLISNPELKSKIKDKFFIGLDIAASSFYKRKKYYYKNPPINRTNEEHIFYVSNFIKNYNLFYIEDPFQENDFESFSLLLKKFPNCLIIGDDLITTNYDRLKKAIELKSINATIIKPNQNGSLIDMAKICGLAKENNIKIVFSHRSKETEEDILSDLCFGFQADYFKVGTTGIERESKIKRLIQIENKLKKEKKI